ncbi:MAG: Flp pilus assembly complex ATPase component TadA [Planctomycetes bacterium]|nr:Flp pilus assembly complex ATPase component TadA [Planctomycetota bacterium]MCW8136750.1 Flp pilus assembly complex ATPase component TadA [Planctomycetota bacterium]
MTEITHMTAWERFDDWINKALEMSATDIHIVPGYHPKVRVRGELRDLDDLLITPAQTSWIRTSLFQQGYYAPPSSGALQRSLPVGERKLADVTCASAGGEFSVAIRLHAGEVPGLDEAGYPPTIKKLLEAPNGLVLIAGPHGSGKTTTLYAATNWINQQRAVHICTAEKPRHYLFPRGKAIVQQREVGLDGASHTELVHTAMQQDCDVVMVGEIESFDTLAAVLHTAETGHLVLVQVHADSVEDAVQRLLEAAPPGMEEMNRRRLHATLRGVVMQRLITKKDGRTRVAVCEVIGEGARKFIDAGKPDAGFYLTRAHDEIAKLLDKGEVTPEAADRLRREFGA